MEVSASSTPRKSRTAPTNIELAYAISRLAGAAEISSVRKIACPAGAFDRAAATHSAPYTPPDPGPPRYDGRGIRVRARTDRNRPAGPSAPKSATFGSRYFHSNTLSAR